MYRFWTSAKLLTVFLTVSFWIKCPAHISITVVHSGWATGSQVGHKERGKSGWFHSRTTDLQHCH